MQKRQEKVLTDLGNVSPEEFSRNAVREAPLEPVGKAKGKTSGKGKVSNFAGKTTVRFTGTPKGE